MRWFKAIAAVSAIVLPSVLLSACAQLSAIVPGTTINIGIGAFPNSWNADLPQEDEAAQLANAQLGYLTQPLVSDFNPSGELVPNEALLESKVLFDASSASSGGAETGLTDAGQTDASSTGGDLLVEGNFVVEYRIKPGLAWSDGVPIDASDLLLSWLAAADPQESGFESLRSGGSLRFSKWAAIDAESGALQVSFSQAVPDYRSILTLAVPAHTTVIAAYADAADDALAAKKRLVDAVANAEGKVLRKLALEYRQAYRLDASAGEAGLASKAFGGAYAPVSVTADSIGLAARGDFSAGRLPQVETVNLLLASDPEAALGLVESGALDVVAPEPSLGLGVAQMAARISASDAVRGGVQPTENILAVVLNSGSKSNLADSAFESPAQAGLVRDAVSRLVPTSEILAFKSAEIAVVQSRSLVFDATYPDYQEIVAANGSESFGFQDLEAAAELLVQSGATLPVRVRVLFESSSPDAQAVWALLSQRATSVGIQLLNQGTERFRGAYRRGGYELAIVERPLFMARDGSGVTELASDLERQGRVGLLEKLDGVIGATEEKPELLVELDRALFAERYAVPLYQYSTLYAISKRVTGYQAPPDGRGVVWGYWNWSVPTEPSATPDSGN